MRLNFRTVRSVFPRRKYSIGVALLGAQVTALQLVRQCVHQVDVWTLATTLVGGVGCA